MLKLNLKIDLIKKTNLNALFKIKKIWLEKIHLRLNFNSGGNIYFNGSTTIEDTYLETSKIRTEYLEL